ncbi:hypothetical protein D3C71_1398090 [compost metagenome]
MAGMNSGFSGASLARSSARRTTRASAASSNSLIEAVPTRLPKATVTASSVLSTMPLVDTLLSAKRMLPLIEPASTAVHSSALDSAMTLSRMALASCSVKMLMVQKLLDDQPRLRAVLMTLMPSKRAVDEPCDTAETWPGWPLPSKNEPPRR